MPERSRATRRLVARLSVMIIIASLTIACTPGGAAAPQPTPSPSPVAVAEPTTAPTVPPTTVPTATAPPVTPLASPSALRPVPPESFFVGNTLGRGMSLRRAPTSTDLVKAWPDGTMMVGLGAQQDAQGWTWAWLRDPDGNAGWMPTQFLVRSLGDPSPPLPLTPPPLSLMPSQPPALLVAPTSTQTKPPPTLAPTATVLAPGLIERNTTVAYAGWELTITDVHRDSALPITPSVNKQANGVFVTAILRLKNIGLTPASTPRFTLSDDSGRRFDENSSQNASFKYGTPQITSIQPTFSSTTTVTFDIALDAKGIVISPQGSAEPQPKFRLGI